MPRVWKKVKRYERWVLIGIVIILLATFSVTGATRQGCARERAAGASDYGGSFEVSPGKRVTVTDEEVREVFNRYWLLYGHEAWGPSIAFGSDMRQSRRGQEMPGTWMHIAAVRAAEAAGYSAGDDEVREGVQELVLRIASLGSRGGGPHDGGRRFSNEVYDQVLEYMASQATGRHLTPPTRADFEQTVREMIIKDKFIGDIVGLERHTRDRAEAFEAWKASRQRLDLQYVSVPAKQFADAVALDEKTRSAVGAQIAALKKLSDAQHRLEYLAGELKKWKAANKGLPADLKEFQEKEPGKGIDKTSWEDPWGTPFAYEKAGDDGRLSSAGPDKKPGTPDDVTQESASTLSALGVLWQAGDAIARWHTTSGAWPASLADLEKAPTPAAGQSPIPAPLPEPLKDPWGQPLEFEAAGRVIRSNGPDAKPGTPDDLSLTVAENATRDSTRVPWPTALAPFVLEGSKDAWDRPLAVSVSRGVPLGYEVLSPGANGKVGDDDDLKTSNDENLASYYGGVRSQYRLPLRREFEALYVIPCLVSDETLTEAWAGLPEYRPSETDAWDVFRHFVGAYYRIEEEEPAKEEPPSKDAPPAKATKTPIDPADKTKGYGASYLAMLKEHGLLAKDVAGWQVPAATCFGDRKDLAPATPGLPSPDKDSLFKTYVEKGWRYVVLRDQFFEKMLDALLKKSRQSKEAHDRWLQTKTGPDTPVVTFKEQLADPALQKHQPSSDATAKGARFLQFVDTGGKPLKAEEWEKVENVRDIGGIDLSTALSSLLKDDEYAILPSPLAWGVVRSTLHAIKRYEPADQPLEAVREQLWPKYVEWRTYDRAQNELDLVRKELSKPPEPPKASDGSPPAPAAPPAAPPSAPPAKPDGEARAKALVDAVTAAAKARGFTFEQGRTGLFIAETARGEREAKPRADATPEAKDELLRRSYVRRNAYDTVRVADAQSGSKPVEPGAIGRNVLKDLPRVEGATTTGRAYLVVVAQQKDPEKAEFNGKEYLSWLRDQAFDTNPEWQPSRVPLADREGYMLRVLHRLYDDWEAYKSDYKIETNSDLLVPHGAGTAR